MEITLPDHTVSMRDACDSCCRMYDELTRRRSSSSMFSASLLRLGGDGRQKIARDQQDYQKKRQAANQEFWYSQTPHSSCRRIPPRFDVITMSSSDKESGKSKSDQQQQKAWDFHRQFQDRNLPCLVTGLDQSTFATVNQLWRTPKIKKEKKTRTTTDAGSSNETNDDDQERHGSNVEMEICRKWFLDNLGEDCQVPLRYHPPPVASSLLLDEDGRAEECQTRHVTLQEWVKMLDQDACNSYNYYLKDWHFQQQLYDGSDKQTNTNQIELYQCPWIFEYDLLNLFLTRFTKGDYRFVYWGPTGSLTGRHSDVLHSFSWSYNVMGTKQWTFFAPNNDLDDNPCLCSQQSSSSSSSPPQQLTILQEAGQAMFVPSKWQHQVVNLEETISINHNWITTSNLDLTWECLLIEMGAIRTELDGWWSPRMKSEQSVDYVEACENMLRGCVGLDVTSFFFMTLSRLLEVMMELLQQADNDTIVWEKEQKRHVFDLQRLVSALQATKGLDEQFGSLQARLEAILQSEKLAEQAVAIATGIIELVVNCFENGNE